MFTIWSSTLQRKLGTDKFRLVVGAEHRSPCTVSLHVFIGGIIAQRNFVKTRRAKWLELGGSDAWLDRFDYSYAKAYVKCLSPRAHG